MTLDEMLRAASILDIAAATGVSQPSITKYRRRAAEHGGSVDTRRVPKATNALVTIHRGYRVEVDRDEAQVEVYRPNLERSAVWWYGTKEGEGTEGFSSLSDITDAIDRDIERQAA